MNHPSVIDSVSFRSALNPELTQPHQIDTINR